LLIDAISVGERFVDEYGMAYARYSGLKQECEGDTSGLKIFEKLFYS